MKRTGAHGWAPGKEPARGALARFFGTAMMILVIVSMGGCGGDDGLPDDAVAEVGDTPITKSDYESALRFVAGREHDPRDYAACVAAKRQAASTSSGAQPPEAKLEKQCREEYEQIKRNVMDYLIKAEWTRQEAEARGVVLTQAEVEQAVDAAEQGGLLNDEALTRAGVSEGQMVARIRQNQLQTKVARQLIEQSSEITAQDIADFYRESKADLFVPAKRETRIVITKTRAMAQEARAAFEAGRSWKSVAREYSIHFSAGLGGRITAEWQRVDTGGLGAAIFHAERGKLTGPVKDDDSWGVFIVDEIIRAHQPTLEQARDEIVGRLRTARKNRALLTFAEEYRDKTTCAPGFRVSVCKNGPKRRPERQPSA